MKTKFTWGSIIKPTKEAVKSTRMVKEEDYGISLGEAKDGSLVVVRAGKRTAEKWSKDYWELV